MSKTLDIFVDTPTNLHEFAEDVASRLTITLTPRSADHETWYEYQNEQVIFTLGEHTFENDRDLLFENYRYHLSVRALNFDTEDERTLHRVRYGEKVFNALETTGQYSLMLVDDLQTKLREFIPLPSTS